MTHTRIVRNGLRLRTLAGRSLAGLVALTALTACGDDSTAAEAPDGATASPTITTTTQDPTCAETWVEGEDLPKGYSGCLDADSVLVKPMIIKCSSGQRLVTHDDEWWAVRGYEIGRAPGGLKQDQDFKRVLRPCLA